MNIHRTKPIAEKKIKNVELLAKLLEKNKTTMLVSAKGLPSSQFQEIRKQLREHVTIAFPKKNVFRKAIASLKKGALIPFQENIQEDMAVLFSDLDAFELAALLSDKHVLGRAKAGQAAPEDIIIEAGATELLPGPAMTELTALGLKIAIEGGKITIKEEKKVVKAGEKIDAKTASLLTKLDIKPVSLGFEPIAAYDSQAEKIYLHVKVDKKATIKELRDAFARILALAVSIQYPSQETLPHLLRKAAVHEMVLAAHAPSQESRESSDNNNQQEEQS